MIIGIVVTIIGYLMAGYYLNNVKTGSMLKNGSLCLVGGLVMNMGLNTMGVGGLAAENEMQDLISMLISFALLISSWKLFSMLDHYSPNKRRARKIINENSFLAMLKEHFPSEGGFVIVDRLADEKIKQLGDYAGSYVVTEKGTDLAVEFIREINEVSLDEYIVMHTQYESAARALDNAIDELDPHNVNVVIRKWNSLPRYKCPKTGRELEKGEVLAVYRGRKICD